MFQNITIVHLENPMHKSAKEPNDLEKLFVERANKGDIDGLVALYEPNAIIADGKCVIANGKKQIQDFFVRFLENHPKFDSSVQAEALRCGNIALTSSRTGNGDVTAEIARRQPDGTWLWVVDQFTLAAK